MKNNKETIIQNYLTFKINNNKLPTMSDLIVLGNKPKQIRYNFGNITKLHEFMANYIADDNSVIDNQQISDEIEDNIVDGVEVVITTRDSIIASYIDFIKDNHKTPYMKDMNSLGYSEYKIAALFGNITNLHNYIKTNHKEEFDKYIVSENVVFSKIKLTELNEKVKNHKIFVVTCAVNNKKLHNNFYKSIKNYCEMHDAQLLIMPCADPASVKNTVDWTFDPLLRDEYFIFSDVKLNENIFLSSIKLSAKMIKPTTGLNRIGQRNGSCVFASPKQFLEFVVTSPNTMRLPHAIMTPGAITVNDYDTDRYMSERTAYIAENDHVIGATIIEIVDDKEFHFRQVQSDINGSFIDLCVQYNPDKPPSTVYADLVIGDWHSGKTDPIVKKCIEEMSNELLIKTAYLHDFFDGKSISHHDSAVPLKMVRKYIENKFSLEEEIKKGGEDINWLHQLFPHLVMVKGNHDEWLERYLMKGAYVYDHANHYISLTLAKVFLDGKMPLRYAYENYGNLNRPEDISWLSRDAEERVGGVELSQHGDMGMNGGPSSLLSMERAFGNCVIGHTHSAAILRGVYRVGTSTSLRVDYQNGGPTSWTHTHCLVYENGSRQLINIINGRWKL